MITLADGQSITFYGVAAASLTASNFVFDQTPVNNPATMIIGDGAMLPMSGIVNNTGTIALNSTGNETHLELIEHGITLQGGGHVTLSDSDENLNLRYHPSVTLTNVDNTMSGAGQLGGWPDDTDQRGHDCRDRHSCSGDRYGTECGDQLRDARGDRERRPDCE